VSDDHDPRSPSFDDPSFDELRALLADARVTEPVPADVAARLDATLAALQEERRAEAVVVPLRRRRTAARVLVAAAAVVVVTAGGVGIAQVAQQRSDGSSDSTAADAVRGDASAESGSDAASDPEAQPGPASAPATAKSPLSALKGARLPAFTTARFAAEVAGFDATTRQFSSDNGLDASSPGPTPTAADAPTTTEGRSTTSCVGPTLAGTTSVPILLDGEPAVLVLHEVTDGTQEVDAWSCDGRTELTTTTVSR
jgi:hypothetical protein